MPPAPTSPAYVPTFVDGLLAGYRAAADPVDPADPADVPDPAGPAAAALRERIVSAGLAAPRAARPLMALHGAIAPFRSPGERAIGGELLLRTLLPAPGRVESWADLLDALVPAAAASLPRVLALNQFDVAARRAAEARAGLTIDPAEWRRATMRGELVRELTVALHRLGTARGLSLRFAPYDAMVRRLSGETATLDALASEPPDARGTLFVAAHTVFVPHLPAAVAAVHPDIHFVSGRIMGDPAMRAHRQAAPMVMLRTLKKGGCVQFAPDGNLTSGRSAADFWGTRLMLADSFAWLAHRSGCRTILLVPTIADRAGTGVRVASAELPRPEEDEKIEAFRARLHHAFAERLGEAMLRHPESVGTVLVLPPESEPEPGAPRGARLRPVPGVSGASSAS